MTKKGCTLEAEVLFDLDHGSTPFDISQTVTGMTEFLERLFIKPVMLERGTECGECGERGNVHEDSEESLRGFRGMLLS